MDGSARSAGAYGYFVAPLCANEQPEAKRRCLNPDRQALILRFHGANTIQHPQILANPHWAPNNWDICNIPQVQAPNQFVDYYQPLPAYGNQALGQWPSNDVSNSPYAVVDESEPQPEPSALDSDITQSPLEETDILVCYGMVSVFVFTRSARNHSGVRRPTVPTLSLLPRCELSGYMQRSFNHLTILRSPPLKPNATDGCQIPLRSLLTWNHPSASPHPTR